MLWIVRPFSAAGLVPITGVDVIFVEVVIVVDVYVTAAVPIAVAPSSSPCRAKRQSGSKSERSITRRIGVWIRISGLPAVNDRRTILRNVNDLWVRRFNDNHFLVVDCLRFDFLLRTCLQIPCALRFRAHALDRIHHIRLLREKRVTQVRSPGHVLAQLLHNIWKCSQ
jgi:hypothetical protein